YCQLDDSDILYTLKRWTHSPDPILADLAARFINRRFFRTTFLPEEPSSEEMAAWSARIADWLVSEGLSTPDCAEADASYYLALDDSRHSAYERVEDSICVLRRDGTVRELSELADTSSIAALTRFVVKPYLCAPKEVSLAVSAVDD
ncbi:MAG: HD domain-containing protein, partial [Bacteroidetes bacterium]|nr:HD domain-containing protein [Bacteroidota bacterium]